MNEINIIVSPLNEIENNGQLIANVYYKPNTATYICIVVSIAFILTLNPLAMFLGVFVLGIAAFVTFKIKDRITLGIYDTYLIMYSTDDQSMAQRFEYDQIAEWNCKSGTGISDALMLRLIDGQVIYKDTFQTSKVFKAFNKVIPKKETYAIREEENKKTKLKFSLPFKKKK